jgi:TPR repeat protein
MAQAYGLGIGVAKDPKESLAWLKKAARNDSIQAIYELSLVSLKPTEGKVDVDEALKLLRKAADRGYPDALYDLGWLHFTGKVMPAG